MKRIGRKQGLGYELNASLRPVLRVAVGESIVIETEDSASGYLRSPDDIPTPEHVPGWDGHPPRVNPVVGPIYVEGVKPGDLLVVVIEDIIPAAQGFNAVIPGLVPHRAEAEWSQFFKAQTHIIRHELGPSGTYQDGTAHVSQRLFWPLQPFIGTLAVAPEREVINTGTAQGPWGGNLDVRDFCKGSRVYLNSFCEGGLLFIGDVHATQGDMEFSGSADEIRAEVILHCEVVHNVQTPSPRIITAEKIVALCSDRPLDLALERASWFLMDWLISDFGFSHQEALLQVCLNPDFRVNVYQMVRSLGMHTVGAELPKKYLR